MSIIWQEAVIHSKVFIRERYGIFLAFGMPIMLLLLFSSVFSSSSGESTSLLAGVICINTMSGALYGVGVNLVSLREQKILRRYKVTPVPLWKVILGLCLSQVGLITVGTVLLMLVAKSIYKASLPNNLGAFFLVFIISTFMFCTMAFAVASIARSGQQANALTQVIFLPMMFLSGATLPYEVMPIWIQKIAMALPATYFVSSLRHVFTGGALQGIWLNIGVMTGVSLIAGIFSVRFFRWE